MATAPARSERCKKHVDGNQIIRFTFEPPVRCRRSRTMQHQRSRQVRIGAAACAGIVLSCALGCGSSHNSLEPRSEGSQANSPTRISSQREAAPSPIRLRDVTAETQIGFCHTDGNSGQCYFVEIAASGLATFDYDNDGLVDIYFLSGVPLQGTGPDAPPGGNALYRNLGNMHFADVTSEAGVGPAGYGLGVTAGDYDNDGFQDLYVSNFGPKVLYRNQGNGTFANVTQDAGVADGDQVGAGVNFVDIDNDGHLDLYVANYVDFSYDKHVPRRRYGLPFYADPSDFAPLRHSLYRNRSDGTFEDVSLSSGIGGRTAPGMGTLC